ncbi:hypothetical protein BO94DRAFT_387150 [Aspergillus sclerotioniger CBS 115572]|uniref:Uncharacterized protein n=1 Tax=Aspergillus sclerotioniger CBS 115572 TaxID=1450535 RepID=A0A317UQK3_9EURO|nr:hypothetical protein BO94DRAFT_387150 [Aspergillus sclerotioniger CBS 115572]PWY64284.1 hypothetical protein BO94DRAFT_387150 [Aspergillus sclerotioniger CBS 115572]
MCKDKTRTVNNMKNSTRIMDTQNSLVARTTPNPCASRMSQIRRCWSKFCWLKRNTPTPPTESVPLYPNHDQYRDSPMIPIVEARR